MQSAITDAAISGYNELLARKARQEAGFETFCPDGGCVFLGRHLALPGGILMLGLNPGSIGDVEADMDTGFAERDVLLEKAESEFAYWRMARHCFSSSAPLLNAMRERATFSFCVPFRTPNWHLPQPLEDALFDCSQDWFNLLLEATSPRIVITAGKAARNLFLWRLQRLGIIAHPNEVDEHPLSDDLPPSKLSLSMLQVSGRPLSLIKTPHFSRTSYALMELCGEALTREVSKLSLTVSERAPL